MNQENVETKMEVEPTELLLPRQLVQYFHVVESFSESLRMKRGMIVIVLAPHLMPPSERAWQWVLDTLTTTEIYQRIGVIDKGNWMHTLLIEMDPEELAALLALLDFYDVSVIRSHVVLVLAERLDLIQVFTSTQNLPTHSAVNRVLQKEVAWRRGIKEWLHKRLHSLDLVENVRDYRPLLGPLVASGSVHTLFLTHDGLWASGSNQAGQLGLRDAGIKYYKPIRLDHAPPNIVQIACGIQHSAIVTRLGDLWMCGSNEYGQLARARTTKAMGAWGPTKTLTAPVKEVVCGEGHTLVLLGNGEVYAAGDNRFGQLGQSHFNELTGWIRVNLSEPVQRVYCGARHNIVLTRKGLWAFGDNEVGQLGLSNDQNDREATPTLIPGLPEGIRLVSCGVRYTIITFRDSAWGWGSNTRTQLFIDPGDDVAHLPTSLLGDEKMRVSDLACGDAHSILVLRGGKLIFSGANSDSQLALNDVTEPVQEVFAGEDCSFLLTERGLWACGRNHRGQLGLGKHDHVRVPVLVPIVLEPQRNEEKRREKDNGIDDDRVTQKRRLGELCVNCDKKWRSIEPMQYRYRFCGQQCYKTFFSPHVK